MMVIMMIMNIKPDHFSENKLRSQRLFTQEHVSDQ